MMRNNLDPRRSLAALLVGAILFTACFGQNIPRAKPESVGMSTERLGRLSKELDKYVRDGLLAGGVVMVARRSKVAFTHVFGDRDREARSPMLEDTIFRIASQSKLITSVGIMILQEEGKLLITDHVGKFIPEFNDTTVAIPNGSGGYEVVKAKRKITIRDLLTHTAGISYGTGPAKDKWEAAGITGFYTADRDEPIGETVRKMAALPMDAHPGEKYIYGYANEILGVVIEKASGMDLDSFFSDRLYDPLGMTDTSFFLPPS